MNIIVNIESDHRDMLNNFCFHVQAQKSLFIAENCNEFFLTSPYDRIYTKLKVFDGWRV